MEASRSCLVTISILIGLFVLISIALNSIILIIITRGSNQLKNINNTEELKLINQISLNLSLIESIDINELMKHLQEFNHIATMENGSRSINTKGFKRTIDYIADYLSTNTNYYIKRTPFSVRQFKLGNNPILFTSIANTIINRTYSNDLSKGEFSHVEYSTDINLKDFINITLIPNFGCSEKDWLTAKPSPNGRIALVKHGACDFFLKPILASHYHVKGLLLYNISRSSNCNDSLPTSLGPFNTLPTLSISSNLAQELIESLNNSATNTGVRFIIDVLKTEPYSVENICADTPIGDITQTIIIGSHSDSILNGPGINDNGSGSAANLALAVALFRTSMYRNLKYRIRFCWWGAEELGLIGSFVYVTQATTSIIIGERFHDHLLYLNLDMLASPNYMFGIYDLDTITNETLTKNIFASKKITTLFRNWFNDENLPWDNVNLTTAISDYLPFLIGNMPVGGVFSGADGIKTKEQCDRYASYLGPDPYCMPNIAFDQCYHKSCDTIWNINKFAYEKLTKAVAYALEYFIHMDNLKEWLYSVEENQNLTSYYKK
ncbi:unnamed protein product [Rotaria sp. Silwood2]|nr:unnamed protein product [Rotaria sp. Silwood2]CAF3316886.1 unnamed protein product [Rotaria sp. Silwood2]CAF4376000.1 unnamed protein product [Rotaria sp. Silwood2]